MQIDLTTLKNILSDHLRIEDQAKILKDIEKTVKSEDEESKTAGAVSSEETENQDEDEQEDQQEEEPPKPPKAKKKLIIILTATPPNTSAEELNNLPAFIAEIPEETSAREIPQMLKEISMTYAETRKAKKNPLKSVGELWTGAPAKLFKAVGLGKKSKEVVEVHYIGNHQT